MRLKSGEWRKNTRTASSNTRPAAVKYVSGSGRAAAGGASVMKSTEYKRPDACIDTTSKTRSRKKIQMDLKKSLMLKNNTTLYFTE